MTPRRWGIPPGYRVLLVCLLLVTGSYAVQRYNDLLFHSLVELLSIIVAAGIFIIFWNTRHLVNHGFFLFVSIGYLAAALINLFHMLAHADIGAFPHVGANIPLQLWAASRAVQAVSFLLATFFIGRTMTRTWLLLLCYALGTAALLTAILTGWFPVGDATGARLTLLEQAAGYATTALLLAALVLVARKRQILGQEIFFLLGGSILATVVSELASTFYSSSHDVPALVGHLARIVAFYLLYVALIEVSLRQPYENLFRMLKQNEAMLLKKSAELRERVKELNCLYEIGALVEKPGATLDEVLKGATALLAAALYFPEIAATRIVLGGREHRTPNYRETPWRMTSDLVVHEERCGLVEVAYVESRPEGENKGLFLDEERLLLQAVTERLGRIVERFQARELLQASEHKFRSVVEQSLDGITLTDEQGYVIEWNRGMEQMTGLAAAQVLGRPIWQARFELGQPEMRTETHRQELATMIQQALRTGQAPWLGQVVQHNYVRSDGVTRLIEGIVFPIPTANGFMLAGISRDVTEIRQVEEMLRIKDAAIAAAYDAIAIADLDSTLSYVNCAYLRMWGYEREEEVLGRRATQFWQEPAKAAAIVQRLGQQEDSIGELIARRRDGTLFNAQITASMVRDAADQPLCLLGVFRDVTRERYTESSLRQAKEEWERTFDAVPDLIAIIDTNHSIVRMNRAMSERLNCTPEECLGQPCYKYFHGTEQPPPSCPHALLLQDHQEHATELHEERLDGDFVITVSPLWGTDGQFLGSVHVAHDVTERKQNEQILRLDEQRLNSLLELSLKAGELSEQEIVQTAIEEAERLTGSHIAYLHFVQPDEKAIQLIAWSEATKQVCTTAPVSHYPLDQAGIWADCVRQRTPVLHNDYQNYAGKKGYPEGHAHLIRHASVPIFDDNHIALILGVGNKETDYDEADIRQLLLIGNQVLRILRRKRTQQELQASLQEKTVLLQEVHHRVKNNLQVISSLLDMQAMTIRDPQTLQVLRDSHNRVRAMAIVHDRLYQTTDLARIGAQEYLESVVGHLYGIYAAHTSPVTLRFDIEDIRLDMDRAIPCGLIVNELVSNALKYAFPPGNGPDNEVVIALHRRQDHLLLLVQDNGVGLSTELEIENAASLGLRLVTILTQQLRGQLEVQRRPGTTFRITFPVPNSSEGVPS